VQAFLAGQHPNVLVGPVPAKYATALIATEDSRLNHSSVLVRGAIGWCSSLARMTGRASGKRIRRPRSSDSRGR